MILVINRYFEFCSLSYATTPTDSFSSRLMTVSLSRDSAHIDFHVSVPLAQILMIGPGKATKQLG